MERSRFDGRNDPRASPQRVDIPLQMVDVNDIGATMAAAFAAPDQFIGETIELAGDELTLPAIADVFSSVLGRTVKPKPVTIETLRMEAGGDTTDMFAWFNDVGYEVEIEDVQTTYDLDLASFETYVTRD